MNIFGSVSGKQIDEFAKGLAREIAEQLPPTPDGGLSPKASSKKIVSAIERICAQATAFANEHKLGVYKKARLGNAFRWEMTALGYAKDFVDEATGQLILRVAGKR